MGRRNSFDSGHGKPEHYAQERLPEMDENTGRHTPEQEADIRRDILISHGNKNINIVNDIANNTNIPARDLHLMQNVPIKFMDTMESLSSPDIMGYTSTPLKEAQQWVDEHKDTPDTEGTIVGQTISREDMERLASPAIQINPITHASVSGHRTALSTTVAHEIGHRLSDRGPMSLFEHLSFSHDPYDTGENHHSDFRLPAMEGSAEGYSARHAPLMGEIPIAAYTPDFFSKEYKTEGPELFATAKDWTSRTGDSLSTHDFRNIEGLTGVLASDFGNDVNSLDNSVFEQKMAGRHRTNEGQRMAINEIDRRDPRVRNPRHEDERRIREMAINGQRIQGSLFPDVVPETNQYGDAPIEIERSRKGNMLNHMRTNYISSFLRSNDE